MQGSHAANDCEALYRDTKRGFRLLFRFPSYSVPVLLLLALGISASTVAFSVLLFIKVGIRGDSRKRGQTRGSVYSQSA